jgi:cytochrome c553
MKTFLLFTAALLMFGGFLPTANVFAEDPALLFEKLTCHTCHGPQGRGMIRMETKERYYLRKKKMFRQMVKDGIPVDTVKKLIPIYKKKFDKKEEYLQAIEELIGKDDTAEYQDIIIKIGGRIYYHKGELIPGFEDYPRHAGNKQLYLYRQMKDILEGKRTNGNTEAMRGIRPYLESNKITDDDFRSIAEYLSNVKDKDGEE